MNDLVFDTVVNSNVKLKEAASFGKTIVDYAPSSVGYKDYNNLAEEVIKGSSKTRKKISKSNGRKDSTKSAIKTPFSYFAPQANSIKVVGNFNDWTPSEISQMKQDSDGMWSTVIQLPPGTYQYKFIIDNEWVEDYSNPNSVESPLGGKNSVIQVG